ncbi:MAG: UDP-N-acetylglucosamine 1-carboxyvinyltransferase [bacterium]|nr:UDP-N-acetylglucosamine 1-carboxyvinyltransferase [bacterium]
MAKFVIRGGRKLEGKVRLSGNKNAALKLIPAALLSDKPSTFTNIPDILDVRVMLEIIKKLGVKVEQKDHTVSIDPSSLNSYEPDVDLSTKIRASVVLAAPLLARFGKTVITPPGGDQIGDRLLETHFSMMQKMGVEIKRENGRFYLSWKKKSSSDIFLDESSVTATEMGLMLASSIDFETKIEDAAAEPHVVDLAEFLGKMGAKIQGAGTGNLVIKGGKLRGCEHKVVPDHIEGGTFAVASAITGGRVIIEDFQPQNYKMILNYLGDMGVEYKIGRNTLEVLPSKLEVKSKRREFQTRPWPGFPTDLMSPLIVLATQTEGTVLCHDWMYEWRIFFVDDLRSMGARIFIADPHRVIVSGPNRLLAERLFCKDIRAGISMILAALVAQGTSEIENIEVVERGYERIEERFKLLGADIKKG